MTEQAAPQPGWYPDPAGSPNLRWWNGVSWSESTHPLPGASPESVARPAYPSLFGEEPDDRASGSHRRGAGVAIALVVVLLAVAGIAVAVLISAVSSRTQLDTSVVEQRIAEDYSTSTGLTTTVVCPDEVSISSGATFLCTATTDDGRTVQIEVTQTDDQGNVTWTPLG